MERSAAEPRLEAKPPPRRAEPPPLPRDRESWLLNFCWRAFRAGAFTLRPAATKEATCTGNGDMAQVQKTATSPPCSHKAALGTEQRHSERKYAVYKAPRGDDPLPPRGRGQCRPQEKTAATSLRLTSRSMASTTSGLRQSDTTGASPWLQRTATWAARTSLRTCGTACLAAPPPTAPGARWQCCAQTCPWCRREGKFASQQKQAQ